MRARWRTDQASAIQSGSELQFLRYSYASNGELKAAYYAATGRNYLSASESATLIALNESISRMTRRLRSTLDVDRSRHRRRGWTKDQGRTKDQGQTKDQGPSTKDPQ